jgi:hypothetical protein
VWRPADPLCPGASCHTPSRPIAPTGAGSQPLRGLMRLSVQASLRLNHAITRGTIALTGRFISVPCQPTFASFEGWAWGGDFMPMGRSHNETCVGCTAWSMTVSSSAESVSRST